jgi:hypothetical protein
VARGPHGGDGDGHAPDGHPLVLLVVRCSMPHPSEYGQNSNARVQAQRGESYSSPPPQRIQPPRHQADYDMQREMRDYQSHVPHEDEPEVYYSEVPRDSARSHHARYACLCALVCAQQE